MIVANNKQIIITDEEVALFCEATKDDNVIHKKTYMTPRHKRIVVPGMYLLALASNYSAKFLKERARSVRVVFGSIISTNESICFGQNLCEEEEKLSLSAFGESGDAFSLKNEYSYISAKGEMPAFPAGGTLHSLEVNPQQIRSFTSLTKIEDSVVARFFFSVAYASMALFSAIRNPITETEKEINLLLDKSRNPAQLSPFYQSLEIFIPQSPKILYPKGNIDYQVHLIRKKKHRLYAAHLRCMQSEKLVFQAKYDLIAIPDRLIMRMIKDL